jgi:hypothetical protein
MKVLLLMIWYYGAFFGRFERFWYGSYYFGTEQDFGRVRVVSDRFGAIVGFSANINATKCTNTPTLTPTPSNTNHGQYWQWNWKWQ